MTGEILELEKESFWKEHQDTLVRLRQDLVSGKKRRSQLSHANSTTSSKRNIPGTLSKDKSKHPPFGKYRRSPSPLLPKLAPGIRTQKNDPVGQRKFHVVPPVKPRLAFVHPNEDYDSWGEDGDNENDDDDDDDENPNAENKQRQQQQQRYKPQPYPATPSAAADIPPVFYPSPPRKVNRNRASSKLHPSSPRNSKKEPQDVPSPAKLVKMKKKKKKKDIDPVYTIPAVAAGYPLTLEEDEEASDDEEENQLIRSTLFYWEQHPLFASDFCNWFIQDCLHTELLPDFLIDIVGEIKQMPDNDPWYVSVLYACDDILTDQVSDMIYDIIQQLLPDMALKFMNKTQEELLSNLIEDVVVMATREIVSSTVVEMAEDYVTLQNASSILHNLLDDCLQEFGPQLLHDAMFDVCAETFINSEVISAEVKEEAEAIARETLQHYDNKILRRELGEVRELANHKLADMMLMEFILSVMFQQGKLWTQDDYLTRYLDGAIFNQTCAQMLMVQREKEKTLHCKPLHKLHEKVVSDVAVDVFLQQLSKHLDEDLADVDEYEREKEI